MKDDNNYVLVHKGDNFLDKLLKMFWIMKKNGHYTKVLSLKNERKEKNKKILKPSCFDFLRSVVQVDVG